MPSNIEIIKHKLCDDFPLLFVKNIVTTLKNNNNSYIASYYDLETQIKSGTLPLKKTEVKKKRIIVDEVEDSELKELFKTFDAIKTDTIDCTCCFIDNKFEEFGQCTNGHLICKKCIKTHAENTIYQTLSAKIACISCNEKCIGLIDDALLEQILDARVFSEYKNLKNLAEIKELCVDDINIKICQHCNSGSDIGDSNQSLLICMECFKDTCLKCNHVAHPGQDCYSLGKVAGNIRHSIEDKMTETMIIHCPGCQTALFKNEGCNKVTCVCGIITCYICKQIVTKKVGYSHFCRERNCVNSECKMCHLWEKDATKMMLNALNMDYNDETKLLIDKLL